MQRLPKQPGNKKTSISVSQTSFYSGKLPSPEMMERYNSVEPSFADRILKMAEAEEQHMHKIESRQLTVSVIMAIFGILSGLLALGSLCYLLYQAIEKENTEISLGIVGIIAAVVAIFVLRKKH
ncbi:MAG TPA: DUF2335 domain-containing protein [Flavobacterium sp.]|jgi:uncharacterized membrane protein